MCAGLIEDAGDGKRMNKKKSGYALLIAAIVAIGFGALTIASGGRALFGSVEARAAVGNAVPFVLWFNFLAGFAYVVAGAGLLFREKWAAWLSSAIALATVLVFGAFAIHVMGGGAYEVRTVYAMILRAAVWITIAALSVKTLLRS
jgi:hypothetical protein